jgi:hypothetical protein
MIEYPPKLSDENFTTFKQRIEQLNQAQETLMNEIDVLVNEYNHCKKDLNTINTFEYENWIDDYVSSITTFPITIKQLELEKGKVSKRAKT